LITLRNLKFLLTLRNIHMKFSYRAKGYKGDVQEGQIEAINSATASALLEEKGLQPLMIEKEEQVPDVVKQLRHLWDGVNLRELSIFFRQLATLIESKVSIVASLRAVGEQTDNSFLKTVAQEMIIDVEDGIPLSDAMSKHPLAFRPLHISMIKAGEVSGNLQRSVLFLADNTEKNYELNSKIRSALFYPAFVATAAVIITFVVATLVLPKLTAVFRDMGVEVPWYTLVLMMIGDFMQKYWWTVGFVILAAVLGGIYYLKTEDGHREWDVLKMKIPIIGKLFQYVYIARFSENLAVLLNGGIPIVRALVIVGEVVDSSVYRKIILQAADEVKTGGAMSNVFGRSPEFPPIVPQMIRIGEEAGKISEVLMHIADFFGKETDRITRNLSAMVEPILICFLGAGVGILVFAILVPIYTMSSQIR
jgi:type IV pilus assembly protein PilC